MTDTNDIGRQLIDLLADVAIRRYEKVVIGNDAVLAVINCLDDVGTSDSFSATGGPAEIIGEITEVTWNDLNAAFGVTWADNQVLGDHFDDAVARHIGTLGERLKQRPEWVAHRRSQIELRWVDTKDNDRVLSFDEAEAFGLDATLRTL